MYCSHSKTNSYHSILQKDEIYLNGKFLFSINIHNSNHSSKKGGLFLYYQVISFLSIAQPMAHMKTK